MIISKRRLQFLKIDGEINVLEGRRRKNRGKWEIVLDILLFIKQKGKTKKTPIIYGANLSFTQLNRYLKHLLKLEFIRKVTMDQHIYYELTEKGEKALKLFKEMKNLIGEI